MEAWRQLIFRFVEGERRVPVSAFEIKEGGKGAAEKTRSQKIDKFVDDRGLGMYSLSIIFTAREEE